MLRRAYLRLLSRLSRRQARRVQRVVMFFRPRARRRAAELAAITPPARLMCIALGVGRDELERLRDRVLEVAGHRPERMVVVSDCDALFGKGSCHFEYVPARPEWERHFQGRDYDGFVARRIDAIAESFRPRRVVAVGELTDPLLYGLAGKTPLAEEEDHELAPVGSPGK